MHTHRPQSLEQLWYLVYGVWYMVERRAAVRCVSYGYRKERKRKKKVNFFLINYEIFSSRVFFFVSSPCGI